MIDHPVKLCIRVRVDGLGILSLILPFKYAPGARPPEIKEVCTFRNQHTPPVTAKINTKTPTQTISTSFQISKTAKGTKKQSTADYYSYKGTSPWPSRAMTIVLALEDPPFSEDSPFSEGAFIPNAGGCSFLR